MTLGVQLFARARDLAGTGVAWLDLADDATVADVRAVLACLHPPLATLLTRSNVAVNDAYAADGQRVRADDRLAVIPPVSGG